MRATADAHETNITPAFEDKLSEYGKYQPKCISRLYNYRPTRVPHIPHILKIPTVLFWRIFSYIKSF